MATKKSARSSTSLRPRLRVMVGEEIALGPGRVDLLEFIQATGSLRAGAKRMGISYMRAWNLVKYTNRSFRAPLVEVARGGKSGGGARLTEAGERACTLYRRMERQCSSATRSSWADLRTLLAE